MASDNAISTISVAHLAIESPDEASIEAKVNGLAPEDVPVVIARASAVSKAIAFLVKSGEKRIVGEALLAVGSEWVDRATGVVHTWGGNLSEWKVSDPDGLARALASATRRDGSRLVSDEEIERALPRKRVPDHRVLSELSKRDAAIAEVVEDNRARSFGPPHLKEKV
jgi:hypothetical protein